MDLASAGVADLAPLGLDLAVAQDDLSVSMSPAADMAQADLAAPAPPTVTATVACNPNNVVTGIVDITVTDVASLRVEYGPDARYGMATPTSMAPGTGTFRMVLLGLTPGATNHARVDVTSPRGVTADSGDIAFDCPPLPAGMPSFATVTGTPPDDAFLLIGVVNNTTSFSVAAMVDRVGRLYWYDKVPSLGDFRRLPDGNFAVYQPAQAAYSELTLAGDVVRSYSDPLASKGADNHELVPLSGNHALLFGDDVVPVDTSPYVDGGGPSTELANTVAEIDADGGVVFHWSSANEITLAETTPDITLFHQPIDGQHANSIDILSDGNLLLSLRHTDTLYKLDRTSGTIAWRLGGKMSDFTFVNDPLGGFSHQHFARELSNGDLLLFDDGNLHSPPNSRVVQYRLDAQQHTATLVWQHHHSPELSSLCCGSTERFASGNTLTAWGTTGVIEEIDASSTAVWQMTIPTATIYRAVLVPTLYP